MTISTKRGRRARPDPRPDELADDGGFTAAVGGAAAAIVDDDYDDDDVDEPAFEIPAGTPAVQRGAGILNTMKAVARSAASVFGDGLTVEVTARRAALHAEIDRRPEILAERDGLQQRLSLVRQRVDDGEAAPRAILKVEGLLDHCNRRLADIANSHVQELCNSAPRRLRDAHMDALRRRGTVLRRCQSAKHSLDNAAEKLRNFDAELARTKTTVQTDAVTRETSWHRKAGEWSAADHEHMQSRRRELADDERFAREEFLRADGERSAADCEVHNAREACIHYGRPAAAV